jgi:thiol-disulfide isomerase/thioredoxin
MIVVKPIEYYRRIWSVFKACVFIPVKQPESLKSQVIPYYLEFWHINDSMDPGEERLLRYSRNGWMEGLFEFDTIKGRILLTEMVMDGIFDSLDHWALCEYNTLADLYLESKQCNQHIWLGNRAFSLSSIDPTGLIMSVKEVFPEKTKEQEIAEADRFHPDQNAKRSGQAIPFLHNYAEALKLARQLKKPLFVDFEADWCGPCSKMNKWVYTADKVVAYASRCVYLKVDGTEHPDLVKKFKIEAYPTMVIFDHNGVELKRKIGYCSVNEMVSLLTSIY